MSRPVSRLSYSTTKSSSLPKSKGKLDAIEQYFVDVQISQKHQLEHEQRQLRLQEERKRVQQHDQLRHVFLNRKTNHNQFETTLSQKHAETLKVRRQSVAEQKRIKQNLYQKEANSVRNKQRTAARRTLDALDRFETNLERFQYLSTK
ncbi:hypothetical protein GEMRC1_013789 [Eukaryota sp. GEM-RC1]